MTTGQEESDERVKEPSETGEPSNVQVTPVESYRMRRWLSASGYLMLAAASAMGLSMLMLFAHKSVEPTNKEEGMIIWLMRNFGGECFVFLGMVFLGLLGIKLVGAAGKATPRVIPPEDRELLEPLVRDANKDAIQQYVILSSLTGFTGTFQKIGFSGLPLATVTLTLLFCALSFLNLHFLEFAKLTLGAFIGSFVQRGTGPAELPSIKWAK